MSDKEVILTQDGLKKLEDELENLKSVKRREVAERIKVAIGYGDISENSEYEDAKNEQAFIEGRIITLEKMLRNARIINNDDINTDVVGVGNTVIVEDLNSATQWNIPLSVRLNRIRLTTRSLTRVLSAKRLLASKRFGCRC